MTLEALSCDFETYCDLDLKKVGAYRYATHESCDALCLAYAWKGQEPQLWLPGQPAPADVVDHILSGGAIRAFNAAFERLIFKYVMGPKYGWPIPDNDAYYCTMTEGLAQGLPGSLAAIAPAVGLTIRKDDIGRRIMLKLCRSRTPTRTDKRTRYTPAMAPGQFRILYDYCRNDVRVEMAVAERLVRLHPDQRRFVLLAAEVNDRGVPLDLELAEKAQRIVAQQLAILDRQMREVTGGEVHSCSAAKQLTDWLARGGIVWPEHELPGVSKSAVHSLLARDDLTNSQRVALELRRDAAKTSTAKLESFREYMATDGCMHGLIQPNGAATGRDAARGPQIQNLTRPSKETNIARVIKDILLGYDADRIRVLHGNPMQVISDCLRACIKAPNGKKLYASDLAQIEARMTAYLAGEEKKLEAFRRYDRKEGADIYTVAAALIYGVDASQIGKESDARQVGKVSELAFGFGGGAGAYASMANIYRLDLKPLFEPVWEMSSDEFREKTVNAWDERGKRSGMAKSAWMAAELVKLAWRETNPNIVQFWKDLENAAVEAILHPKTTHRVGYIKLRKTGSFLRMVLPSGRSLFFPYAKVEWRKTPWGTTRPSMTFWAVDGMTKQWMEFGLWGGLLCQNAVQAASFDVMRDAVIRLEEAGYPNCFRVHDEAIAMTDDEFGSLEEYNRIFTQAPLWAPDLPVAGSGWEGDRYRK